MSDVMNLTLVLAAREPMAIHRIGDVTSDPGDPRYGQYLDRAQLESLVRLATDDYQRIVDWLASHGMVVVESPTERNKPLMFVTATRQQVEAAFGEDLLRWIAKDPDNPAARMQLALPCQLAGYVLKIGGLAGAQSQMGISIAGLGGSPDPAAGSVVTGPDSAAVAPAGTSTAHRVSVSAAASGPPKRLGGMSPADIREINSFPAEWDGSGETIALLLLGGRLDSSDLGRFWKAHGIRPPAVHVVQVGPATGQPPHPLHTLEAAMSLERAPTARPE